MKATRRAAGLSLAILLAAAAPRALAQEEAIDLAAYSSTFNALLADMGDLISTTAKSPDMKAAFAIFKEHLDSGEVALVLDAGNHGILGGAAFEVSKDGSPGIRVGLDLIDAYRSRPSDVFCVLMHEIWHARDFYHQHDAYLDSFGDSKESYWYDLDAMHVVAEFIEECVQRNYRLSRFQQFFLMSWRRDNLDWASTVLHKESMRTFFYFNGLEGKYRDDPSQGAALLEDAVGFGREALEAYGRLKASEAEMKFTLYVVLKTYDEYLSRLIGIMDGDRGLTWDQYFAEHEDVGEVLRGARRVIDRDRADRLAYPARLLESWEGELRAVQ
jgi:hypothetical protein